MEDNKDLIPDAEVDNTKSQEVVANATTEEVSVKENDAEVVKTADKEEVKVKKTKKAKEPMQKKKKIIIITAAATVGAVILGLFIWLMVILFGPGRTQDLSSIPLKVDMANKYYMGTEGQVDYKKIFPDGDSFVLSSDKKTLTFKMAGKEVTKEVTTIDGAVNVSTFDALVENINAGKKVVIQNASLKAPKLEGKAEDEAPTMTVKNDVYGNGAVVNVNELIGARVKTPDKNDGKLAALSDGTSYSKTKYFIGFSAFTIVPREDNAQVIFQDVHITGNDMSTEEGGNLAGLDKDKMAERGVKLFSGYGSTLYVCGNEDAKANALVKHCVFENGGKVVHISNSKVDMQGCIVRNAADTAVSIETAANKASTINMKDNVIANSLTGAILFYCMDTEITKDNEDASWNTLNIDGFLDIYNWKNENNLSFLPETEDPLLANIANAIAGDEIPKANYDALKAKEGGEKYIHFAIIKIRTGSKDMPIKYNGSKVNGCDKVGYSDSKANGQASGFPIPPIASKIMYDIDVWGYYSNDKGSVGPTDGFSEKVLEKLYEELREGRN